MCEGLNSQRTRELYARRLKNHVYPPFGKRLMRDLRHSEMRAWLSALEREYRPWTVYGIHSMFRTICKCAVADKVRPDSPFAGIKLKAVKSPAVVPMSVEQVGRLCAAAPPRYRALFVLAAATGMRGGELLGLELGCVDFLRRTVRVERQLVQYRSERAAPLTFALGPPKTETSRRVVEVPQYALDELARHLQQWPATRSACRSSTRQALGTAPRSYCSRPEQVRLYACPVWRASGTGRSRGRVCHLPRAGFTRCGTMSPPCS